MGSRASRPREATRGKARKKRFLTRSVLAEFSFLFLCDRELHPSRAAGEGVSGAWNQ